MIYVSSGGTNEETVASINVIYPTGGICTCSKGTKTLKAKDTNGQWTFYLPSLGTWTVTCTDGSNPTSKEVSITSNGQRKSVTLEYETVVFKQGMTVIKTESSYPYTEYELSNGQTVRCADSSPITSNGLKVANGYDYTWFKNACSMDGKSKIYIELAQNAESYSGRLAFDLYLSRTQYGNYDTQIACITIDGTRTGKHFELDISAITGDAYICIMTVAQSTSPEVIVTKLAIV